MPQMREIMGLFELSNIKIWPRILVTELLSSLFIANDRVKLNVTLTKLICWRLKEPISHTHRECNTV